jgi:hypothetical protein
MADWLPAEMSCSLCGKFGPCFRLEYALCPRLPDAEKEKAVGCYTCLRQGHFEFWHDTEVGELDEQGLKKVHNDHRPPSATFRPGALQELRRTPQIVTWQQELWLTHCDDFMAYIGTREPKDFAAHASNGDGRSLFLAMTEPELAHLWDESLRPGETEPRSWHASYYVFRCLHCGKQRGNWDCD